MFDKFTGHIDLNQFLILLLTLNIRCFVQLVHLLFFGFSSSETKLLHFSSLIFQGGCAQQSQKAEAALQRGANGNSKFDGKKETKWNSNLDLKVEACNNIMAYGFIIIILLLTGFYWFIMIFSTEIKDTFQVFHLVMMQLYTCIF